MCGGSTRPWLEVPLDWRRPAELPVEPYHLVWCDHCLFGELHPRPTVEQVLQSYQVDDYYTHHASLERQEPTSFLARLKRRLASHLDRGPSILQRLVANTVSPPAAVLDVGCGGGGFMIELARRGYTVRGLEPDPAARARAVDRGLQVDAATIEELVVSSWQERYDAVVMRHVLEHCLDPRTAIRVARSLLKPSGILIIEVPNNAAAGVLQNGKTWHWLDVPRHLNFFTGRSLERLINEANMDAVEVGYRGYVRQFNQKWLRQEELIRARLGVASVGGWWNWWLLMRTCCASHERKYDSVYAVARNQGEDSKTPQR